MPQDLESDAIWREAWSRLPLPRLAEKLGDKGEPRSGDPCPFCGKKHKFGIFERGGRHFFKCHSDSCDAYAPDGPADEIGYLALRRGLSRKDAALEYLRLAVPDLLKENQPAEVAEPGTRAGRSMGETSPELIESRNPHHAVWKKLSLTAADFARLQNKRGFSPEIIRLCGFRSNNAHNREPLMALLEEYPVDALVAEGIFKRERFKEPHPAGQLVGWGRTGKKDPQTGREIFSPEVEPIIIPYFEHGVPYYLRPHKGGLKKPEDPFSQVAFDADEDDDDDPEEKPCASFVYVPPGTAELVAENDGMCIFTEGEFKAVACRQALVPAIATPGTSFMKNARFRRRLTAVLEELGVTNLVVIYDNEVKDDPQFSTFKEDPHDRYDVQVWAAYAQIMLAPIMARVGGSCRVGWLPDEFRENGKADFDGVLAKCVYAHGLRDGTTKARRVFLKTVADARRPGEFVDLFADTAQRIIQWKIKQKLHKWKLLSGGSKESERSVRFSEMDGDKAIDRELAGSFRDVVGCYYKRANVSKEERGELVKLLNTLGERVEELKGAGKGIDDAKTRIILAKRDAIFERLRGMPEQLSTFTLRCEYRLHGADGNVIRLVRIIDSKDLKAKSDKLYRLHKSDLAGLRNFREWIYGTGGGTWHGGEKDLQNLAEDLDHQAFMRDIHEIVRIGWDKTSGIWFLGDAAKGPNGETIYPDDKGIFWHEGFGYQIDVDTDERGATGFIQGLPYITQPHGVRAMNSEELDAIGGVRGIFINLARDLFDNVGGYDAWVALGLMLAYGVAPELLKINGEGHPAPWFFGTLGEGKSTVMGWLLRIWGFRQFEGVLLNDTLTDNALARITAQYSCLPIFIDEARRETLTATKLAIIRSCYQRQLPAKATADYTIKVRGIQPATSPMIGGESSSHDGATRSRFGQINVAARRRIGDAKARKTRVDAECNHYYRVGDWILSNRPRFVETVLFYLDAWGSSPSVRKAISKDRVRFVHGVAFACMKGACHLLDIPETGGHQFAPSPESLDVDNRPRTVNGFSEFLLTYAEQATRDVEDETFLTKFWEDVRALTLRRVIRPSFFKTAHYSRNENGKVSLRVGPPFKVPTGSIPVLLVAIKDVFPLYEEHYRKRFGQAPPLGAGDVRRSMEREPYWVPPEKGRAHHRPKDGNGERGNYWALSLEFKPKANPDDEDVHLWTHAEAMLEAIETNDDKQG